MPGMPVNSFSLHEQIFRIVNSGSPLITRSTEPLLNACPGKTDTWVPMTAVIVSGETDLIVSAMAMSDINVGVPVFQIAKTGLLFAAASFKLFNDNPMAG
jgi:hypothetical protein